MTTGDTNGSARPTRLDVQNALRILFQVMRHDEEIVFCVNDLVLLRDHLYRTQEAAEILVPNDARGAHSLQGLVRKPRHKWFAHTDSRAENGWSGPHDHIEDAARAALLAWEAEGDLCYIAQGRKLTKSEYEEQGAEYTWEVDTLNAMMLRLPNIYSAIITRPLDLRTRAAL